MKKVILAKAVKTAISLPAETYRRAEALRRKAGKSRSELYSQALQALLKAEEIREKEAQYIAAYRKHPETPEELAEAKAWIKLGAEGLEPEDWSKESDAPR